MTAITDKRMMPVSLAEERLLRRIRQLRNGSKAANGAVQVLVCLWPLTLMTLASIEVLEPDAPKSNGKDTALTPIEKDV